MRGKNEEKKSTTFLDSLKTLFIMGSQLRLGQEFLGGSLLSSELVKYDKILHLPRGKYGRIWESLPNGKVTG